MTDARVLTIRPRPAIAAALVALLAGAIWHAPARAQQVAALVNGDPITALDIAQRMRLMELATRKPPSRKDALDELIDQQLKLQVARQYRMEITDKDVDNAFANMARRAGASPQQFGQSLGQAGIRVESLKARIKADIGWTQLIRGKFPSALNVGESDITTALQSRKPGEKNADAALYQYTLRPILFIVPRGSSAAAFEARKRDAEGLRTRFQNCEEGVTFARALSDVAVRDQIVRASGDLGDQQRAVLDSTAIGRLTPPEITQQGVETFAVCGKDPVQGDTVAKRQVRETLLQERYDAQAKRYLQELRRSAMIEIR
jgi:peptidyl-prolyl cis-trans isomerase SurA